MFAALSAVVVAVVSVIVFVVFAVGSLLLLFLLLAFRCVHVSVVLADCLPLFCYILCLFILRTCVLCYPIQTFKGS